MVRATCDQRDGHVDHLAPLRLRTPDGGIRLDGTRATDEPRLHLVGYGPSASTIGANRAGRRGVNHRKRHAPSPRTVNWVRRTSK